MVSTHSIDVLEELVKQKPKDAIVVVLRKRSDDVVEHKTLSLDEVEDMIDSGVDIRKIIDEMRME